MKQKTKRGRRTTTGNTQHKKPTKSQTGPQNEPPSETENLRNCATVARKRVFGSPRRDSHQNCLKIKIINIFTKETILSIYFRYIFMNDNMSKIYKNQMVFLHFRHLTLIKFTTAFDAVRPTTATTDTLKQPFLNTRPPPIDTEKTREFCRSSGFTFFLFFFQTKM